jgi:anti-anti-sigma regulatory factor
MERRLENVNEGKNLIFFKGKAESKLIGAVEYVDMAHIHYITNSDIAELISLVKFALSKGKEVRLINVKDNVLRFINKMGLQNILLIENKMN